MDKKTEALKLALEALEYLTYEGDGDLETKGVFYASLLSGSNVTRVVKPVTTAIREALAEQPAQDQSCPNCKSLTKQVTALKTCLEVERGFREQEQPAQQQEPVARVNDDGFIVETGLLISPGQLLYTSPQSKPWVGLTDEEKAEIKKQANYNWETTAGEYASKVQDLTEAKLREKNA